MSEHSVGVWMPVYVGERIAGMPWIMLNNRQAGALDRLHCHAWRDGASLPDDLHVIAKMVGETVRWLKSREGLAVLAEYPIDPTDGRRRNAKQSELYAQSAEQRRKYRERAEKGAAASNAIRRERIARLNPES